MPNTVPAAATGLPIPHPRLVELIERRNLRVQVAKVVSRLIAVLDAIDGDPEIEPVLGAPEQMEYFAWTREPMRVAGRDQRRWANGVTDDRETVDEDGGDILDGGDDDRVDGEPSLGAPETMDQTRWSQGGRQDVELVDEDGEHTHA